jgi:anti-sigma-K factor RskA
MTTNQDLHELTAAYALDALDADERSAYEAHLAECDRCRTELRDLGETVGALALTAEGPAPPAALRDRILVAAREEGPANVVAIGSAPRRRWYAVSAVAAAAAAALAIGLWAGLSGGGGGSPNDKLAASVSVDNGVAELTVSGLPDAPNGKAYEIWVIEGKTAPKPAGLFTDTGESVALTRPAPAGSTVAVTLEQAGGSETPTAPIRVSTTVPA